MNAPSLRNLLCLVPLVAPCVTACSSTPDPAPPRTDCSAQHDRVGQTLELQEGETLQEGASGRVIVADDCTLVLEDFTFQSLSGDLRVVGVREEGGYVVLTPSLNRSGGYENDRLEVKLPRGVSLDDFDGVSVMCTVSDSVFAHASFEDEQASAAGALQ